jgi:CheY-like chemotaxis protein
MFFHGAYVALNRKWQWSVQAAYGELPTMPAKPEARIPASSNAQRPTCWNAVEMAFRVLIVDDNRSFLEAARGLLEREGLRVVGVAATSAEALQRAQELQPEVILVDIRLGGESGFDLARRLAGQQREGPAVILISTYSEMDFADLIAESPARGFLPKPGLSADAIRRIVDDHASGGPPGARSR